MNTKKLSQILELYFQKSVGSAIEDQNGGCGDFAASLANYLIDKGIKDFEYGYYMGIHNGYECCPHEYIRYKGLIFDSVRFGEETTDSMEDYFCDVEMTNEHHKYEKSDGTKNPRSKSFTEEFDIIEKELKLYGFEFLLSAYSIFNNYSLIGSEDEYRRYSEGESLDEFPKFTPAQKEYIIKHDLITKYNKYQENRNKKSGKNLTYGFLKLKLGEIEDYSMEM